MWGHPVQRQLQRFLGGRRADSGDFHLVRDRPLLVQVQVLLKSRNLSVEPNSVRPGDIVILTGDIGRHGISVMTAREALAFETEIPALRQKICRGPRNSLNS